MSSITQKALATKALLEASLNQTIPAVKNAYGNVESVKLSMAETALEAYARAQARQALIETADLNYLKIHGRLKSIFWKGATKFEASLLFRWSMIEDGASPVGWVFSMIRGSELCLYTVTSVTSGKDLIVESNETGEAYNLPVGAVLEVYECPGMVPPNSPLVEIPKVGAVRELGQSAEDKEVFRVRVMEAYAASPGGGNSYDYRFWAEKVPGVKRAYPYSALPGVESITVAGFLDNRSAVTMGFMTVKNAYIPTLGLAVGSRLNIYIAGVIDKTFVVAAVDDVLTEVSLIGSLPANPAAGALTVLTNMAPPGARTVYIESDDEENPLASPSLLEAVRQSILTNEEGLDNLSMGDVAESLFVMSMDTLSVDVRVEGVVTNDREAIRTKCLVELDKYFKYLRPFCNGLDTERRDVFTKASLIGVVSPILEQYKSSFTNVSFFVNGSTKATYTLGKGKLPRMGLLTIQEQVI